jgi:hypothetical protein
MNLLQFIRLILRNISIVTIVPLAMAITILIGTINSPDNYKSSTTVYTGFASGYSIENGEKAKTFLQYILTNKNRFIVSSIDKIKVSNV